MRLKEPIVFQLEDCDGVHFLNFLELSDGRLSMRFFVPNLVISIIDVIFVACAIDFHSLKENLKVRKIVLVLATDNSLEIENSGREITKDDYQLMKNRI